MVFAKVARDPVATGHWVCRITDFVGLVKEENQK